MQPLPTRERCVHCLYYNCHGLTSGAGINQLLSVRSTGQMQGLRRGRQENMGGLSSTDPLPPSHISTVWKVSLDDCVCVYLSCSEKLQNYFRRYPPQDFLDFDHWLGHKVYRSISVASLSHVALEYYAHKWVFLHSNRWVTPDLDIKRSRRNARSQTININ